jgi:hypothetical protein
MPRFHFHLSNGRESLDDREGLDLPGRAAAREEAVRLARLLTERSDLRGRAFGDWFITITDAHGKLVDRIPVAPAAELAAPPL